MRLENTWTKRETIGTGSLCTVKDRVHDQHFGNSHGGQMDKAPKKEVSFQNKAMDGDDESRQEHDVKQYHFCRHSVSHKS